jgi:16S rRNA (cytosine967-C5)-methyltransferase
VKAAGREGRSGSGKERVGTGVRGAAMAVFREWSHGERHAADGVEFWSRERGLSGQDRGFLLDVVFTTLRNLHVLDHWIRLLTGGRPLDEATRWLLRSALTEVLLLEVAEHAAVNENVAQAGRASGLVNAVLRRACREKSALKAGLEALEPEVRFSHPAFLLERWRKQFGEAGMLALARWNQEPAPVYVRLNRLHMEAEAGMAGVPGLTPQGNDFYRCEGLPLAALAAGWCYAQDPSTALAPSMVAAQPGMAVLDACAAPGGKTALLAQAMGNEGRLVAADLEGGRLRRLTENLQRLRVRCAEVRAVDWLGDDVLPFGEGEFDRILLDAPCSNTGVMRRRVDVRWRLSEGELERMVDLQRALLKRCVPLLKAGGRLVYSTCSVDALENEEQVAWLLEELPGLECVEMASRLPQRDGVDGAFAAVLAYRGGSTLLP